MKQFFIILFFLISTSTFAQNTTQTSSPDITLDYYSFEEFLPKIKEQYQPWNGCRLPFFMSWLCGTPLFPNMGANATINEENLYPFKSLVDVDAMLEHYNSFLKQQAAFTLRNQSHFRYMSEEQRAEMLKYNEEFDTWEDFVYSQQLQIFTEAIASVIGDYTDGYAYFSDNSEYNYVEAWSNINMQYYVQWTHLHFQPPYKENEVLTMLSRIEAEALLGATPTLLRTTHSLYLQDPVLDSQTDYDEFVWVHADEAIGVYTKRRYQIVDEAGQALAPLEDGVETRFGTKAFGDFEVVDIRVLFDLVPIEE